MLKMSLFMTYLLVLDAGWIGAEHHEVRDVVLGVRGQRWRRPGGEEAVIDGRGAGATERARIERGRDEELERAGRAGREEARAGRQRARARVGGEQEAERIRHDAV